MQRLVTAVVLHRRDLGEHDRVATLLTREEGKMDVAFRGARKPGARAVGASEPFTVARFYLAHGRRMDVVTQWETLHTNPALRLRFGLLARAAFACDLTRELTEEHEPCPEVFEALTGCLGALNAVSETDPPGLADRVLYAYECRFLQERGYSLSTRRCAQCAAPVSLAEASERVSFAASAGGVLCRRCRYQVRDSFTVPVGSILAIERLTIVPLGNAREVALDAEIERGVRECLRWSVRFRCEKEPRSAATLDLARSAEKVSGSQEHGRGASVAA